MFGEVIPALASSVTGCITTTELALTSTNVPSTRKIIYASAFAKIPRAVTDVFALKDTDLGKMGEHVRVGFWTYVVINETSSNFDTKILLYLVELHFSDLLAFIFIKIIISIQFVRLISLL